MRRYLLALIALAGVGALANSASAQYFPYNGYGYYANTPSGLSNYPTVYNPWARYRNNYNPYAASYYNYSVAYNYATMFNASLYPPYSFNNNYNYGYQFGFNNFGLPRVQQEVGGFVGVNRNTAVNPVSGTILKPNRGVALTREGAFYQVPGTGSISAFGTYIPGSGVYVNPLTGTQYSPSTGLIVRP